MIDERPLPSLVLNLQFVAVLAPNKKVEMVLCKTDRVNLMRTGLKTYFVSLTVGPGSKNAGAASKSFAPAGLFHLLFGSVGANSPCFAERPTEKFLNAYSGDEVDLTNDGSARPIFAERSY
jgi:hypothetical protein